jgi:hypothetical protein
MKPGAWVSALSFFRRATRPDNDELLDARATLKKQRHHINTQDVVLGHQRLQIQQQLQLISALEEELHVLRLSLQHDHHPLVTSRMIH